MPSVIANMHRMSEYVRPNHRGSFYRSSIVNYSQDIAPEVECIGKGKAHAPYEFGVKVALATTLHRSKGGQFAVHAKTIPGNPYDGHTLAAVLPEMEATIGGEIERVLADAGYNFRLLLNWLKLFVRLLLTIVAAQPRLFVA